MGILRSYWWKLLGLILLTFAVYKSFVTPLAPGIIEVSPSTVKGGESVTLTLTGYNTHFAENANRIFLSAGVDVFSLESTNLTAINNTQLQATFTIPDTLPKGLLNVIVNNAFDGTFINTNSVAVSEFTEAAISQVIDIPTGVEAYFSFPFKTILYETLRNLNFHVTMWFALLLLMTIGVVHSVKFLASNSLEQDSKATEYIKTGLLFGSLGIITGAVWARFTWGAWWVSDPKLNGAAISMLIYFAYLILRGSVEDESKKARLSAVYNIFAYVMLIVFIQVLPRLTDSLHPGNGGNPAFSQYDLDNNMRMIFYPATLGWMTVGVWIAHIRIRMERIKRKLQEA